MNALNVDDAIISHFFINDLNDDVIITRQMILIGCFLGNLSNLRCGSIHVYRLHVET